MRETAEETRPVHVCNACIRPMQVRDIIVSVAAAAAAASDYISIYCQTHMHSSAAGE